MPCGLVHFLWDLQELSLCTCLALPDCLPLDQSILNELCPYRCGELLGAYHRGLKCHWTSLPYSRWTCAIVAPTCAVTLGKRERGHALPAYASTGCQVLAGRLPRFEQPHRQVEEERAEQAGRACYGI